MKILLVSQYFYPENFKINDLIFSLKKRGHDITVLTGKPNYSKTTFFEGYGWESDDFENIHDIPVYRANLFARRKGSPVRLFLNYISFAAFATLKVRKIKGSFDLIFVYQTSPVTVGIPAIFAKKIFKAPIYFWVQDLWPESLKAAGGITNKYILGFFNWLTIWMYNHSRKVLIQSDGFREYIMKQGISDNKIVYYPNPTEIFYTPLTGLKKYSEFFEKKFFNIVFAGNIGEAQSFDTIIGAMSLVKNLPVKVIVLGEGRFKETALSLIHKNGLESHFNFLGSYPSTEMPIFFSHADALLVSLKKEKIFSLTIPAKVQSYLACGKPIIGSLDGSGAKVLIEAKCGFVSPAEDIIQLSQSIKEMMLLDKNKLKEMGNNGRYYYNKEFDRKFLLDRLEKILNS
ncbi:MAG: glycosyltransferase family 4 protein [Proteobacteria bacterium]|nr:glycosyltransferase family 4 protein [Pseudomonadota bacterium]MDA1181624.1 glycosyltransferase family 4 protein [Pseudomonadota bacterium]